MVKVFFFFWVFLGCNQCYRKISRMFQQNYKLSIYNKDGIRVNYKTFIFSLKPRSLKSTVNMTGGLRKRIPSETECHVPTEHSPTTWKGKLKTQRHANSKDKNYSLRNSMFLEYQYYLISRWFGIFSQFRSLNFFRNFYFLQSQYFPPWLLTL